MAYTIVTEHGAYHFSPARQSGKSAWEAYRLLCLLHGEEPDEYFTEVDVNQDDETEIRLQDPQ